MNTSQQKVWAVHAGSALLRCGPRVEHAAVSPVFQGQYKLLFYRQKEESAGRASPSSHGGVAVLLVHISAMAQDGGARPPSPVALVHQIVFRFS